MYLLSSFFLSFFLLAGIDHILLLMFIFQLCGPRHITIGTHGGLALRRSSIWLSVTGAYLGGTIYSGGSNVELLVDNVLKKIEDSDRHGDPTNVGRFLAMYEPDQLAENRCNTFYLKPPLFTVDPHQQTLIYNPNMLMSELLTQN
jgi:hypothetical protein